MGNREKKSAGMQQGPESADALRFHVTKWRESQARKFWSFYSFHTFVCAVLCLLMSVHAPHECSTHRGQERASDTLCESQMVGSCPVDAGN